MAKITYQPFEHEIYKSNGPGFYMLSIIAMVLLTIIMALAYLG